MNSRLSQGRNGSWYRPDNHNATTFADVTAANNTSTVFVPQDASRPIEPSQSPPIVPEILMYAYPNGQNAATTDPNNVRDTAQPTDSAAFPDQNNPSNGTQSQSQAQARHGSRCPFYRRVSMSGYHNMPSYSHSYLQNGNTYFRPAYAPHELLWHRQQNNQEIHRRHMMNTMSGTNTSNENATSSSFGTYPNRGTASMSNNNVCAQCDQQHPIGHPHHRRVRQFVCGLNVVGFLY